jgi:hypothetical protein
MGSWRTGTALAVKTEQRVSAVVQLGVAALAAARKTKTAASKATRTATKGSAADSTWAATVTATARVTRKQLTVTEMDAAKPALAREEAAVAMAGVAAKMVKIMTTSIVMAREVAAEAVEDVAIMMGSEQAVTWIMVATTATVEASGIETSMSIIPSVAVKMVVSATTAVLAVAVRTAAAKGVVIWVACYVSATSGV